MGPEEIRNQCEDDADRAPSDLTVWRDRGLIIAAQQTRIAQLEAQIARLDDAIGSVVRLAYDARRNSGGSFTAKVDVLSIERALAGTSVGRVS